MVAVAVALAVEVMISDLQGVKISTFPLTLLVIITTVLTLPHSL